MSTPVEQIKERLSIEDVVGSYLSLAKAGTYLKATCPFHQEKTPSFFVSPSRGTYYCFGCGAKGDIFTFVEQLEGLDFSGALRMLAQRAGVALAHEQPEARKKRERLFALLESATQFFAENLKQTPAARTYLDGRGLSEATVSGWRLGYAPDAWEETAAHLRGVGYTDQELEDAGMIKARERGGGYYDRFRDRIIFPLADTQGRIVGFSGRILTEKEGAPKYLNSPETALFDKSRILYGLSLAKGVIRKHDFSIVVEGQLDVLLAHQVGFANTVATSGTALSRGHLEALSRFSDNVLFAYDSDTAGIASAVKSAALALSLGMNPKVAPLPAGSDPADVISTDPSAWRGIVRGAQHVIDFYLDVLTEKAKDERAFKLAVQADVLPLVRRIPNKIDQEHFIGRIAGRMDIPADAVRAELEKTDPAAVPAETPPREVPASYGSRADALKTALAGIIAWQQSLEQPVIDVGATKRRAQEVADLGAADSDAAAAMAAELYAKSDVPAAVEDLFAALEELRLRDEIHETLQKLRAAEQKGDEAAAAKILEEYTKLSQTLSGMLTANRDV